MKDKSFAALFVPASRCEIDNIITAVCEAKRLLAIAGLTATSERRRDRAPELLLLPFNNRAHAPPSLDRRWPARAVRKAISSRSRVFNRPPGYLHPPPQKLMPRALRKLAIARVGLGGLRGFDKKSLICAFSSRERVPTLPENAELADAAETAMLPAKINRQGAFANGRRAVQTADQHSHIVRPAGHGVAKDPFLGCEALLMLLFGSQDRPDDRVDALCPRRGLAFDHEHVNTEQTYVLKGSLVDKEGPRKGIVCGAGEFIWRERAAATSPGVPRAA